MMLEIVIQLHDDGTGVMLGHDQPEVLAWCERHGKRLDVNLLDMGDTPLTIHGQVECIPTLR